MSATNTFQDNERFEGYIDGFNLSMPNPSGNRSYSYRHGFEVGRSDKFGNPAFGGADNARRACKIAEINDD